MRIDHEGLEFLKLFSLAAIALSATVFWLLRWRRRIPSGVRAVQVRRRAKHMLVKSTAPKQSPKNGRRYSAWQSKRLFDRDFRWLVAGWVIGLLVLLSLPQRYRISEEWEHPVIIAALWSSLLIVAGRDLWGKVSFWVALASGLAGQVYVIKAMHPENMRSHRGVFAIGVFVGFGLFCVVFGAIQN
jgi:hypothetical protein